ncbi:MAG: Npun_F0494 family protein [Cyanobacteria bacterium P01_F01_bin.86]
MKVSYEQALVMITHFTASSPEAVAYSPATQQRAERAAKCSPFRLKLFQVLRSQSVSLQELTDSTGIHKGYTRIPLGELAAENELLWLLAVGLLRREVDGQGLTDSFRLTPLGRQLLDRWQLSETVDLKPHFQDHLYNSLSRWLRLPGWLQN